jgi:antitoxin component YwqK of YwqJK toxin-antitoxin module
MKHFLILILSLLTVTAFAQEYPDSGFTNIAEAKNLTVNGLKEGKWIEYKISYDDGVTDTPSYRLEIFIKDTPVGMVRDYYLDNKLKGTVFCIHGKENGVAKTYYLNGKLESITPYIHGKINGTYKRFYDTGILWQDMPYTDNEINGTVKEYDKYGNIEREFVYKLGRKKSVKTYE